MACEENQPPPVEFSSENSFVCSSVVSHPPVQPASLTLASRFVVISSNSGDSSVLIASAVGGVV